MIVYMILYYATITPVEWELMDGGSGTKFRAPRYQIGGDAAHKVFAPAFWLDQQVRSSYWEPQPTKGVNYWPPGMGPGADSK